MDRRYVLALWSGIFMLRLEFVSDLLFEPVFEVDILSSELISKGEVEVRIDASIESDGRCFTLSGHGLSLREIGA